MCSLSQNEIPLPEIIPLFHKEKEQRCISLRRLFTTQPNHEVSDAVVQALAESAPDGIVLANQEDRIVLVNIQAEKLFGYSREGASLVLIQNYYIRL